MSILIRMLDSNGARRVQTQWGQITRWASIIADMFGNCMLNMKKVFSGFEMYNIWIDYIFILRG